VDLVHLCGENASGEYVHILQMVDIATGWSEVETFAPGVQSESYLCLVSTDQWEGRTHLPLAARPDCQNLGFRETDIPEKTLVPFCAKKSTVPTINRYTQPQEKCQRYDSLMPKRLEISCFNRLLYQNPTNRPKMYSACGQLVRGWPLSDLSHPSFN
jgi:hypothetical protein